MEERRHGPALAAFPDVEHGSQETPCVFDGIVADEQCLIAEHTVEQKPFVGIGHGFARFEDAGVFEIHAQRAHAELGARLFRLNGEPQTLFRLNVEG